MTRKVALQLAILCALAASAVPSHALPGWLEGELSLATGIDYREGDYGEPTDSEILYLPFTASYLFDHFALTATPNDRLEVEVTLPWLRVDGPVVPDGSGGPADPETGDRLPSDARNGLGDVQVSASYLVFPPVESRLPAVELSGRVKLPTGSEKKALSTGEPTYTVQVDVFKSFGEWTPFASGGYRIVEKAPGYDLRDAGFASLGVVRRFTSRLSAGIFYDWWQSGSAGYGDAHELFPYASFQFNERWSVSPYAVIGLSPDATRWGLGMAVRVWIPVRNAPTTPR